MYKTLFRLFLPVLIASVTVSVTHCSAWILEDVSLSLEQGSGNGFAFSYLHSANGFGPAKAATGNHLVALGGSISNSIVGDYNTVTEIFTLDNQSTALNHSELTLSSGSKIADSSLRLTGGKLIFDGTFNGGFIDYVADVVGGNEISGSFYFAANQETGNSNSPVGSTPNSGLFAGNFINFAEWGNNWTYSHSDSNYWSFLVDLGKNVESNGIDESAASSAYRMGIDLHGGGAALNPPNPTVPEPMSFAVWGSLMLFSTVTCGRRRK